MTIKACLIWTSVVQVADGKKHLITVPLTRSFSFPHKFDGIFGAAKVMLRPASEGTGVIAGLFQLLHRQFSCIENGCSSFFLIGLCCICWLRPPWPYFQAVQCLLPIDLNESIWAPEIQMFCAVPTGIAYRAAMDWLIP